MVRRNQVRILASLSNEPDGLSGEEISERTGIDRARLEVLLPRLVARGWIQSRARRGLSSRGVHYALSSQGREVCGGRVARAFSNEFCAFILIVLALLFIGSLEFLFFLVSRLPIPGSPFRISDAITVLEVIAIVVGAAFMLVLGVQGLREVARREGVFSGETLFRPFRVWRDAHRRLEWPWLRFLAKAFVGRGARGHFNRVAESITLDMREAETRAWESWHWLTGRYRLLAALVSGPPLAALAILAKITKPPGPSVP